MARCCRVMGRRKTSQKKLKKKRPTVATVFKCLFCNHERSVECTLKHKEKIGMLKCRICGEEYQTRIHYLTEPIDVYSEWLDATEEAQAAEDASRSAAPRRHGSDDRYDRYGDDDEEDDDDDEGLFAPVLHQSSSSSSSSDAAKASSAAAADDDDEEGLFGDDEDDDLI